MTAAKSTTHHATAHPQSDHVAAAVPPRFARAALAPVIGAPDAEDHALYDVTTAPGALAAEGSKLGSNKICTDSLRWCGEVVECWHSLSPEEQERLNFDMGLVRVLFAATETLLDMVARRDTKSQAVSTEDAANEAAAAESRDAAAGLATILHAALVGAAGRTSPAMAARVDAQPDAHGSAVNLAASLGPQCTLARELLADAHGKGALWLTRRKINAAWLTAAEAAAALAKTDAAKVVGAHGGAADQSALDTQDGRVLALMDTLRHEIAALHTVQPRMELLHPIATRSYFSHPRRAVAPATPPSPAPAAKTE